MKKRIEALFQEAQKKGTGLLAAGFMDLTTGETAYLNPDTPVPTASVYKIFVLCRLFQMQKEGALSFAAGHILRESEKSIGSGMLEKVKEGTAFSLMDYIMLMMTVSDNTATDYLVGLVGQKSIQEKVLLPFGLTGSKCDMDCAGLLTNYYGVNIAQYRAKCGTGKWFDCYKNSYFRCTEEKNNQTTPKDMVKLLSLLNAGQAVDAASDRQMLNIMAQCKTNARIPAKLPGDVVVEHKTGSIDHLANDAGIVRTHKGDYILFVSYNGNLGTREEYDTTGYTQVGNVILSELSYEVYQAFTEKR